METDDSIYFSMSNFYKAKFIDNYIEYNCGEQYFMYKKCLMFDSTNKKLLNKILTEISASKIKHYEATKNDWAIGYNAKDAITMDKNKFGLNLLGKALMEIRHELLKN